MGTLWMTMLAVLAVLLLDAALALGPWLRLVLSVLLAVGLLIGILRSVAWRADHRTEAMRDARQLEQAHLLGSNPLINAICLSDLAAKEDQLAGRLARRCLERGGRMLEGLDHGPLFDHLFLRRQLGWFWSAVVAWLVVLLIFPPLLGGGMLRLIQPLGGHPPVSLTQIVVQIAPETVYEGDDVTVTATLQGRSLRNSPRMAGLVEVDKNDNEIRRWPIQMGNGRSISDEANFRHVLVEIRRPLRFRVEAGSARSKTFTIDPQPRPQPPTPRDAAPQTREQGAGDLESGGSLRDQIPQFIQQLEQLAEMARQLRQQSQQLSEQVPRDISGSQAQAWLDDYRQLQAQHARFQQLARELAAQMRQMAGSQAGLESLLRRSAADLKKMGSGMPGAVPSSGKQPATRGQGFGADGQILPGVAGQWLEDLSAAGLNDRSALEQLMMQLQNALSQQTFDEGQSQLGPWPEKPSVGQFREVLPGATGGAQPDGFMQQVPWAYRDLTGRYFQRISEDEKAGEPAS